MRQPNHRSAKALITALLCACCFVQCGFAESHTCSDYAEFKQILQDGKRQLRTLPRDQALPIDSADPYGRRYFPGAVKAPASSRKRTRVPEETEPRFSNSEADRMASSLVINNEIDKDTAYALSKKLINNGSFEQCGIVWKKILDFCSTRNGENSSGVATAKAYLARIHVLLGAEELNVDLKKDILQSGYLDFPDVAFRNSATFCTGDRNKLKSHWNSARELYSESLTAPNKNASQHSVADNNAIQLQLACLDEWAGDSDKAFDRAYNLLKNKSVLGSWVHSQSFISYHGSGSTHPEDFLVRFIDFHKDFPRAAIVERALISKKNDTYQRRWLLSLANFYIGNGHRAEAWLLLTKLVEQGDYPMAAELLSSLIISSPESEKPLVVSSFAKIPATTGDARALENKGWFQEAELRYISLNKANPNSELYQFEMADFYQRRKNWRAAEKIYLNMVNLIKVRCERDLNSVADCKSLLLGVTRAITDNGDAKKEFSEVRKELKQAGDLCDRRASVADCIKLSEELHETAFSLEKRGDVAGAKKLYASCLEIKDKNLPVNDLSKVSVIVDLARIDAEEGNADEAKTKFERAIAICQRSQAHEESFLYALENYGDFLSKTNQQKKADEIYDLARKLKR